MGLTLLSSHTILFESYRSLCFTVSKPCSCAVTLYMGKGSKREQWHLLRSLPDFSHFPCYPQSHWALLVLLPSVWLCVCSRPLWVFPKNSPVRLGVSPTATSTPAGVFNEWFEALFPHTGALHSLSPVPPAAALPVQLHNQPQPSQPCRESSPPVAHLDPSYQSG